MKWMPYFCGPLLIAVGAIKILRPFLPTADYPSWYAPMMLALAIVECGLGVGVLWGRTRVASSAIVSLLGLSFILFSVVAPAIHLGFPSCGCVGRYRLSGALRLALAGVVAVSGGLSLASATRSSPTRRDGAKL